MQEKNKPCEDTAVGGHLVLFAIMLILSSLVGIIIDSKITKIPFIILMVCGSLIIIPNIFDLEMSKGEEYNNKKVKIATVQGSYKPPRRNMQYEDYIMNKLEYYMDLVGKEIADITVFPETELGICDTSNQIDRAYRERLIDASKRLGGISVFTVIDCFRDY